MHSIEIFGLGLGFLGVAGQDMLKDDFFGHAIRFIHDNVLTMSVPVEAFIVISGYSLMLVVARRADGHPSGGLKGYFLRRLKRIWPPYYAAVALSLLATAFVPGMGEKTGTYWDVALPALTPASIGSHLLFIHNWIPEVMFKLNPPMWTIAVEEQIYVLFPFILLPIWRRWGMLAMWSVSAVVGVGVMVLNRQLFGSAHSWFLMLFGFGALAASINFRDGDLERWFRTKIPWKLVSAIALPVFAVLWKINRVQIPVRDAVFAVGVIGILIGFTERWKAGEADHGILGWLNSYPLALLGSFSYSLYLMHAPLLTICSRVVLALGITGNMAYVTMLVIGVPVTVLAAYGFHRLFERPFLSEGALPQRTVPVHRVPSIGLATGSGVRIP